MRRSNFPDLTSSSEMTRSNEFKSCFTIRRTEESNKLQIQSNRQWNIGPNSFRSCFTIREANGSDKLQIPLNCQRCSGSNYSDLASSSEMRRSCFIVRDEKVNLSSDLASSSGMRRSTFLQILLHRQG
ncbi:hypothetical protein V6N13_070960 [Hibiscus sabdariffa]